MATSAFKSTTKRAPINGSDSDRTLRRSRSLSRFSRRLPFGNEPAGAGYGFEATPGKKFVNTVRGSEFPEISLDDLALDFFNQRDEEKSGSDLDRKRGSGIGRWAGETASSRRRGRSVSRQGSKSGENRKSVVSDRSRVSVGVSESNSRRRRSVSAVRYHHVSDSESDADRSRKQANLSTIKNVSSGNNEVPSNKATAASTSRHRRPLNQKDLTRLHDGYSSHSSALTDDEIKDYSGKFGNEKTIRAVYSQKKAEHPTEDDINSGWYEAMKKGLRYAVEEIKTELEQGITRKNGNHLPLDSAVRNNYITKLEESEKRKQDLLAEIQLEDQKGRELSRMVKELLPDTNNPTGGVKQSRTRKKSNDRIRMSRQLTEEAEKYLEEFISNVEDTDISSFDGERSDGSSTLGGIITKARDGMNCSETGRGPDFRPVEMDGVVLPWLKWETSNDGSLPNRTELKTPPSQKSTIWDAKQERAAVYDQSCYSTSSQGSYSPAISKYHDMIKLNKRGENEENNCLYEVAPRFDMHECLQLQQSEDLLFERYRERHRISSGALLTCTNAFSNLIF